MRSIGTSQLLSWRWAPCVALVLGASCFAAFAMLVIPDHIGTAPTPGSGTASFLSGNLASTQTNVDSASRFSGSDANSGSSSSTLSSNHQSARSNVFPKRGFTPPLERAAPPPPPPPQQQPLALEVQPPVAVPVPPPPEQAPAPAQAPQAEPELTVRQTD